MPFPDEAIDARVELRVGETWTDITGHVYTRDPITITGGRTAEGSRPDPGRCSLTLNNADGRYSPRNPLSPYYGLIGRNTPLRVSVPMPAPRLYVSSAAADRVDCPDAPDLDITGDLDVAVDVTADSWRNEGILVARYTITGNQRSWALVLDDDGAVVLWWSPDGTGASRVSATSRPVPPTGGRLAVRAQLDVNNGAGGRTVTFFTAPEIAGPWTQLGDPVTTAGVTSVHAGTAEASFGALPGFGVAPFAGYYHAAQVRNGIGGTLVIDVVAGNETPGAPSFTDETGNVWTLEGETEIVDRDYRFVGEVPSWPPQWDTSGTNVWTPIEAAGITRRLGQGAKPLQSALRRSIASKAPYPVWWPMEDSPGSVQAASGYPGRPGLRLAGGPTFTGEPSEGVGGGAEFSDTTKSGAGVVPELLPDWVVAWWFDLPALTGTEDAYTGSPIVHWECPGAAGAFAWDAYAAMNPLTGHQLFSLDVFDSVGGIHFQILTEEAMWGMGPRQFAVHAVQGGSGIELVVYINGVLVQFLVPVPGDVLMPISTVGVNTSKFTLAAEFEGVVSHLLVAPGSRRSEVTGHVTAGHGYVGETAGTRLARLCAEEGIPLTTIGDLAATAAMGGQQQDTLLDLLGGAAEADGGTLGERRNELGLSYRPRTLDYNTPPGLTLDYHDQVAAPLEPVEDDQAVRNDVTVERQGGSSARVVREDGPLSVAPPPDGVGLYDESVTLNVAEDSQLLDQAGWRVHLGTVDEARYPVVRLKLHKHPDLIDDALALHLRSRVRLTGLPAWMPPGDVDLLIDGYTEVIEPLRWTMEWNTVPGSPWQVGTVDDDVYGRADTDGSQLLTAVDADDTTLLVATPAGPYWTTDPAEYPYDLAMGGEVVTATAAGDGLLDPFNRTVSNGLGAAPDGQTWTAYGTASHYSVNGSAAQIAIPSTGVADVAGLAQFCEGVDVEVTLRTLVAPITGAAAYYYVLGNFDPFAFTWYALVVSMHPDGTVRALIEYKAPSGATSAIAAERTIPGLAVTASAWRRARLRIQDGRIDGKVWADGSAEPDWQISAFHSEYTTSDVGLQMFLPPAYSGALPFAFQIGELILHNPQKLTVTRATNGIAKGHAAGADIRLAQPMIVAL